MSASQNHPALVLLLIICSLKVVSVVSENESATLSGSVPEPEPEPSPTMRVNPEPENPYGEPENPQGEPEGSSPEPEGIEDRAFAEPVPLWEEAFPMWKAAWEIHIYGMGVLFALLGMYSLVSIIRLRKKRLLSRGYFVALNLMMLLMGVDRAVYLFVDAYNHKLIWPPPVAYLLLGLGFPCLTSSFSILFLALLQSTRTRLVPPKIQQPKFLAIVIVIHFTISIASDVIVGFFGNAQALLLVCQGAFLIWGISLSLSYLIIFRRLYKSSKRQFREVVRLSMSRRSMRLSGVAPFMKKPQNRWGNAIKVTLVTSFMGLVTAALQLYGASVVYGPFATEIPEAWPWWAYQFIFRICEFIMCAMMSFVATQPFRYTSDGQEKPCTVPCVGIGKLCCGKTDHEIDDVGDEQLWNTDMFESAQLDSEGRPTASSNAVSVGLDPLESGNLTIPVNGNKKVDFSHSPPKSPDSMTPIMELQYHQNNQNSNSDCSKKINFKLDDGKEGSALNDVKSSPTEKSIVNGVSNEEQIEDNVNTNNSLQSSPVTDQRQPGVTEENLRSESVLLNTSNGDGHDQKPGDPNDSTVHLLVDNTTEEDRKV